MIHIDGSIEEGGGQILRTALALSTITGKPFSIENIRKNRPVPGLKQQHMISIQALKQMSGCKSSDIYVECESLEFTPGPLKEGEYTIDIGTAGSITLLLQSILLPCIYAQKKFSMRLSGGTDVKWSPSWDYFTRVTLPYFQQYASIETALVRRGYYPTGNGLVSLKVQPNSNNRTHDLALNITDSKVKKICGSSYASLQLERARVAERQKKAARQVLAATESPQSWTIEYQKTKSVGSVVTIWAEKESGFSYGVDTLGEKGTPAEEVGRNAAKIFLDYLHAHACVDEYLADQLIPLIGLYGGALKSTRITEHMKANMQVTHLFLNTDFKIEKEGDQYCIVVDSAYSSNPRLISL